MYCKNRFLFVFILASFSAISLSNACPKTVEVHVQCSENLASNESPLRIHQFSAKYDLEQVTDIGSGKEQCFYGSATWGLKVSYLQSGKTQMSILTKADDILMIVESLDSLNSNEKVWLNSSIGSPSLVYSKRPSSSNYITFWINWGIGGFGRDRTDTAGYPNTYVSTGPQSNGTYRSLEVSSKCSGKTSLGSLKSIL